MKITYLHQYFNTPEMSGSTRSYEMARRLSARGHRVNMITSWREKDGRRGWFETGEDGIRVHWLPVVYSNKMSYRDRINAFLRFAWGAAHRAASLPSDVIFATSTPLTIALPGSYAAMCQRVPMVFEVRDLWPELPIAVGALKYPLLQKTARSLERFAYRRSERIIALSPGMKEGVMQTGFPEEKITVIPNSSDLDFFIPGHSDQDAFRSLYPAIGKAPLMIYTGSIGKINGVGYLPKIAAASRAQGFMLQFAVVGQGMEEKAVRAEAEKLGVLGVNFHMHPAVPKRKMPEILAAADLAFSLFVDLKPMWANSANKFFDALASGTPVAINYGGWQAELIEKSGAGIVLPPDNPEEAARRLNLFATKNGWLKQAGKAARKLAENHFNRDLMAEHLEKVLISAVTDR